MITVQTYCACVLGGSWRASTWKALLAYMLTVLFWLSFMCLLTYAHIGSVHEGEVRSCPFCTHSLHISEQNLSVSHWQWSREKLEECTKSAVSGHIFLISSENKSFQEFQTSFVALLSLWKNGAFSLSSWGEDDVVDRSSWQNSVVDCSSDVSRPADSDTCIIGLIAKSVQLSKLPLSSLVRHSVNYYYY